MPRKVALAVLVNEGKVLIQRRIRKDVFVYEFPGGSCDSRETFAEGAIRELFEETGIDKVKATENPIIYADSELEVAFVPLIYTCFKAPEMVDSRRKQTFFWFSYDEIPMEDFQANDVDFIQNHLEDILTVSLANENPCSP